MKLEICGAFNSTITVRLGETEAQAAERAERALQSVLDRYAKSYDVRLGVDFGELRDSNE